MAEDGAGQDREEGELQDRRGTRTRSRTGSPERSRRSRSRSRSRSRRRSKRSRSSSRSRSRSRSREDPQGYRVHVADLNEECRKKDLERLFMPLGPLREIWLASYAPFYAFIVFRRRADAEAAVREADGELVQGRRVRVSLARPRQVGPRDRFLPDKFSRDRDDYYYRGRDYDQRDYYSRDRDYSRPRY